MEKKTWRRSFEVNPRPRIWRVVSICLAIWFCGKMTGKIFSIPHPPGPEVHAKLAEEGELIYRSRMVGSNSHNDLVWIPRGGKPKTFRVSQHFAGPDFVVIKRDRQPHRIWLETENTVLASLDIDERDFRAAGEQEHRWAKFGAGTQIGAGRTWGVLDAILPW